MRCGRKAAEATLQECVGSTGHDTTTGNSRGQGSVKSGAMVMVIEQEVSTGDIWVNIVAVSRIPVVAVDHTILIWDVREG